MTFFQDPQLGSGLQLTARTLVGTFVSSTYTNADEKSDEPVVIRELVQVRPRTYWDEPAVTETIVVIGATVARSAGVP